MISEVWPTYPLYPQLRSPTLTASNGENVPTPDIQHSDPQVLVESFSHEDFIETILNQLLKICHRFKVVRLVKPL